MKYSLCHCNSGPSPSASTSSVSLSGDGSSARPHELQEQASEYQTPPTAPSPPVQVAENIDPVPVRDPSIQDRSPHQVRRKTRLQRAVKSSPFRCHPDIVVPGDYIPGRKLCASSASMLRGYLRDQQGGCCTQESSRSSNDGDDEFVIGRAESSGPHQGGAWVAEPVDAVHGSSS